MDRPPRVQLPEPVEVIDAIIDNRDQDKMNVARRTCGYIGTQFWNQGRTAEIKERVLHL